MWLMSKFKGHYTELINCNVIAFGNEVICLTHFDGNGVGIYGLSRGP